MSREFGSYESGYFHDQIAIAARDCSTADYEISRHWGALLEAFHPIAYEISNAEAGDSNEAAAIMASMEHIAKVRNALEEVQRYLNPFHGVIDEAIRKHTTPPPKAPAGADAT